MDTKTAGDLMLPLDAYAIIGSDRTLKEALQALSKAQLGLTYDRHQHRAILVLDAVSAVVGKLTHWAILRSLDPELVNTDEFEALGRTGLSRPLLERLQRDASRLGRSVNRMCTVAAEVRVAEAMIPVGESIDASSPISEAIQQFVHLHAQSLLVRERGTVVGIRRLSDVFEEVADRIRAGDCGTTRT